MKQFPFETPSGGGSESDIASGFDAPRPPLDQYAADLYKKHGLGEAPSLADIEPTAIELLASPANIMEATSLMLSRRVDAKEMADQPELGAALLFGTPQEKFGLLLLARDTIFRQETEA